MTFAPIQQDTSRTPKSGESCVSWLRVLGVLRPFIAQWGFAGKWRARTTSDQHQEWAAMCSGAPSIRELLTDDERIELEKLLGEIDQFSAAFKNADLERWKS